MSCFVLIAGLPASGKTTFAQHLSRQLGLPMVSKDRIKELMYDTIGFRSREQKVTLSIAASELLYYFAESLMCTGAPFILENNFENVQKAGLQRLIDTYAYRPVTVRFVGDIRVVYQRYLARDTSPQRHGGHKTSHEWPQREAAILNAAPSLDEFIAGVQMRGIGDFSVGGEEIQVDATDFQKLSYEELVRQVKALMDQGLLQK